MNEKKWVRRTWRQLSKGLEKLGYQLGKTTIGRLLKKKGASHLGKKRKIIRESPSRIMMRFRYLLALNRKKYLVNYF